MPNGKQIICFITMWAQVGIATGYTCCLCPPSSGCSHEPSHGCWFSLFYFVNSFPVCYGFPDICSWLCVTRVLSVFPVFVFLVPSFCMFSCFCFLFYFVGSVSPVSCLVWFPALCVFPPLWLSAPPWCVPAVHQPSGHLFLHYYPHYLVYLVSLLSLSGVWIFSYNLLIISFFLYPLKCELNRVMLLQTLIQ